MFWKFIRWGGTLAVVALVLAAAYLQSQGAASDAPVVTPAEEAPQPNKNFNL